MTVLRDLKERVEALEEREPECCSGSSWASELSLPVLLIGRLCALQTQSLRPILLSLGGRLFDGGFMASL